MKKFLIASFMLVATLIIPHGVFAQAINPSPTTDPCPWCTGDPSPWTGGGTDPSPTTPPTQTPGSTQITPQTNTENTATDKAFNSVMLFIMGIFAWLLGVAALVLDYATYYTVVVMGDYVHNLKAVGMVWSTLRDLGNIVLIFGFIAVGISVILNTERMGYGKKMLPMLLVAAVFINFSLFISEAVIDVGNLFATELYAQINGGSLPTVNSDGQIMSVGPNGQAEPLGLRNNGLANKIMNQVGLQTIYGQFLPGQDTTGLTDAWPSYIAFMAVLLFIITAFVMFSLAFILISRFVMLILLIILAPVGFAGLAVPKLSGIANKWWSALFNQALIAPALLLVLYVALQVITDAQFLTGFHVGTDGWLGFTKNTPSALNGFAGLTVSFLVGMGLLVAVTILAKNMSATGAGFAMKWGSKLSGIGLASAGVGVAGRYTVGAGSRFAAKKLRNSRFAGSAIGRSFVGRGIASGLENTAKRSFDIRNTDLGKSTKKFGLDLGEGQKGGYQGSVDRSAKSYEEAIKGISDRKQTSQEKAKIFEAQQAASLAGKSYESAKKDHQISLNRRAELMTQIAALEAKQKQRSLDGTTLSPEELMNERQEIEAARKNLEKTEGVIGEKQINLDSLAAAHESAKTTASSTEEEIKKELSAKVRKQAYIDSLAKIGTIPSSIPLIGGKMIPAISAGAKAVVEAKKKIKEEESKGGIEAALKTELKKLVEAENKKSGEGAEAKPAEKKPEDAEHK